MKVNFLIDTGASIVLLPESLAEQLGYDLEEMHGLNVETANGQVVFKGGSLGGVEISGGGKRDIARNVRVAFGPDSAVGTALLGMSVLGRYRMTMDDDLNEIILERNR